MRFIGSRGDYYRSYYYRTKELYRINYQEKKERKRENDELYKEFGGEEKYYKNELVKLGFLVINKKE